LCLAAFSRLNGMFISPDGLWMIDAPAPEKSDVTFHSANIF
jgi:hypothetical protein